MQNIAKNRSRRGNILFEFAISAAFLIPLIAGMGAIGLALVRYLEVGSIARATGSMFVRGADFTQPGYKKVVARMASNLGMANANMTINTTGKGIIYLSQLTRIGNVHCNSLPTGVVCTNRGKVVIVKRVPLGNTALRASSFGSPSTTNQRVDGSYPSTNYMTESQFAVAAFPTAANDTDATPGSPVDLRAGDTAYAVESYFIAPEINIFPRVYNVTGFYHRLYF